MSGETFCIPVTLDIKELTVVLSDKSRIGWDRKKKKFRGTLMRLVKGTCLFAG